MPVDRTTPWRTMVGKRLRLIPEGAIGRIVGMDGRWYIVDWESGSEPALLNLKGRQYEVLAAGDTGGAPNAD